MGYDDEGVGGLEVGWLTGPEIGTVGSDFWVV
jgi:hypothetical protein